MIRTFLKPFSFVPALILMYMIYSFSAQPADVSSQLSYRVSYELVETADYMFETGLEDWQIQEWAYRMNGVTRKLAHMTEYFALAVAVSFPLYVYGVHGIWLMLLAGFICVGFACGDEYHQSFVEGRGPSVRDVCIDSFGVFWGIILVRIIGWTGRKTIFRPRKKRRRTEEAQPMYRQPYAQPMSEQSDYRQSYTQAGTGQPDYQQPYVQPGPGQSMYQPYMEQEPSMYRQSYSGQNEQIKPSTYRQPYAQPKQPDYQQPYVQPQQTDYQQPYVQPEPGQPQQTDYPQSYMQSEPGQSMYQPYIEQEPPMHRQPYGGGQDGKPKQSRHSQTKQSSAQAVNTPQYERHPYHPYTQAREFVPAASKRK